MSEQNAERRRREDWIGMLARVDERSELMLVEMRKINGQTRKNSEGVAANTAAIEALQGDVARIDKAGADFRKAVAGGVKAGVIWGLTATGSVVALVLSNRENLGAAVIVLMGGAR